MQQNYYFNGARNDKVINPHLDFFKDYDIPIQFSDEMKDDIVITHRIGGEPMHVPIIGFKTKEEALKIIQYFIIHKEKIPDFKWVNLHEIDFPENKIVNLF